MARVFQQDGSSFSARWLEFFSKMARVFQQDGSSFSARWLEFFSKMARVFQQDGSRFSARWLEFFSKMARVFQQDAWRTCRIQGCGNVAQAQADVGGPTQQCARTPTRVLDLLRGGVRAPPARVDLRAIAAHHRLSVLTSGPTLRGW